MDEEYANDCNPDSGADIDSPPSLSFQGNLEKLLNECCMENESNTPDFILANYLKGCLDCFNDATKRRDEWYSIKPEPGWNGERENT